MNDIRMVCKFKFQSDSINTKIASKLKALELLFKFQSDSINTDFRTH